MCSFIDEFLTPLSMCSFIDEFLTPLSLCSFIDEFLTPLSLCSFIDEFLTPMSTPPSELEDEEIQKAMDVDKVPELNFTEGQVFSKIYEK